MIVVKHVDSIFGSMLPIRLSTFKLVYMYNPGLISYKVYVSTSYVTRPQHTYMVKFGIYVIGAVGPS